VIAPATMSSPSTQHTPGIGYVAFIVMMALLMALGALGIDAMLPVLPAIAHGLGAKGANSQQLVITSYLVGFGLAQIIYGPLADRYGRKPVLLVGLAIFLVASAAAAFAPTFESLLILRAIQGVGASATRVVPISIVRDRYEGRQMARVMSMTSLVFMAVPIIAPSIGALIVSIAPWRWVFGVFAIAALGMGTWMSLSLPETLHPEDRIPIQVKPILNAFAVSLKDRAGSCYTIASALTFGALLGFINASQQVFAVALKAPGKFPATFAIIAGCVAVASLINARLVERLGSRVISHAALFGFIGVSLIHAAVAFTGHETLLTFTILQGAFMFTFGLMGGNFGAMAMENLGHVAGTASSVQGFISMLGGSLIGFAVGQCFDGTVGPMMIGDVVCGLLALVAVLVAEKGKLFQAHHAGQGEAVAAFH
jgi:DHA1 family bicyclomycin/chloramphenicol resistance-like MFS transporter